jgi:hypothetical protein
LILKGTHPAASGPDCRRPDAVLDIILVLVIVVGIIGRSALIHPPSAPGPIDHAASGISNDIAACLISDAKPRTVRIENRRIRTEAAHQIAAVPIGQVQRDPDLVTIADDKVVMPAAVTVFVFIFHETRS